VQHTVVIVFIVGLLLSFFLSGMEAGVFALSRLRIRHYVRQGQRRARVLHEYLEKPESFLWTILIGNTLSAVAVVSIGVHWLHRWLAPNWLLLTLSLAAGILIYYAAFELLPKTLFRLFPNRLCLALALPFRAVYVALRPVVKPLAVISRALLRWSGGQRFTGHMFGNRDELRIVMQESGQALSTEERSMINRVLDLQVLSAAAITTPLLLVHAELDQGCPIGQSEQMFSSLRRLGREVEMLRIPGEGHLVVLTGSGAHRLQRWAAIDAFLDRQFNNERSSP